VGAVNPDPGDEIITTPITDIGTIIPIVQQNAIPIFADLDPRTYTLDPPSVAARVTAHTRAIIAVHLFGNPCDMDALLEIARPRGIAVIEDCAQAYLAEDKGRRVGALGTLGCFSLQQSKHMTTGDGGMTLTDDEALHQRMWLFSDKGFRRKAYGPRAYASLAPCYRMNEQTAAVGLPQLKRVRARVEKRMALGARLSEIVREIGGVSPAPVTPGGEHSCWGYPLGVHDWDVADFSKALEAEGVSTMPGYIGRPIYICAECCAAKKTYGDSHFPYDSPYNNRAIEYTDAMCPNAARMLARMTRLGFDESFEFSDIEDMGRAIAKVARLLPKP
jgi:perosamine synthetase